MGGLVAFDGWMRVRVCVLDRWRMSQIVPFAWLQMENAIAGRKRKTVAVKEGQPEGLCTIFSFPPIF
jgi:hypothetical protein